MARSSFVFLCMIWSSHDTVTCQKNKTVTILLNQTLSWADGLKECHNRNGTLVSEEEAKLLERNGWPDGTQPEREYWTGTHQYLSDWLGTLGWEYESKITAVASSSVEMEISSPGACQELCSTQLFAIAGGSTCFCVPTSQQANFTVKTARVLNWTTCDNPDTPDTCGGTQEGQGIASLYGDSAYSGVSVVVSQNGNCATARCDTISVFTMFKSQDCQIVMNSFCTSPSSISLQSTWDGVYRTCLNDSSFIATSLSLCTVFIQGSRIRNSDYWIGHKRQFYSRTDKGDNINMSLVQYCQSCNSTGSCTFQTQCRSVQKPVLCTVPFSEEITTKATDPPTDTFTTPPGQTTTGEKISAVRKPDDPFPLLPVLIAVGGTLVGTVLLILTTVTCLRLRRKKETNKEKSKHGLELSTAPTQNADRNLERTPQGQPTGAKDTYDYLDHSDLSWSKGGCDILPRPDIQNIYHVIETNNTIPESESNVYDVSSPKGDYNVYDVSSPKGDHDEDVYNHLRETFPAAQSDNVYDVGGRPGTPEQGIYNHLHVDTTKNSDNHYAMN